MDVASKSISTFIKYTLFFSDVRISLISEVLSLSSVLFYNFIKPGKFCGKLVKDLCFRLSAGSRNQPSVKID